MHKAKDMLSPCQEQSDDKITLSMTHAGRSITITEQVPFVVRYSCGAMAIHSGLHATVSRMATHLAEAIWRDQREIKAGPS
jgi:hypothetical protein